MLGYAAVVLVLFRAAAPPFVAAHPIDFRSMTLFFTPGWIYLVQALVPISLASGILGFFRWIAAGIISISLSGSFLLSDVERQPDWAAARTVCMTRHHVEVCVPSVKSYLAEDIASTYRRVVNVAPLAAPEQVVLVDDEGAVFDRNHAEVVRSLASGRRISLSDAGLDLSAQTRPDRRVLEGLWLKSLVRPGGAGDSRAQWVVERQALRDLGLPSDGSLYPGAAPLDQMLADPEVSRVARKWQQRGPRARGEWLSRNATAWRAGDISLKDLG
ncbi:hypothetical protein ACQBJO_12720 [Janibacter sp. G349]|uniref:hypothetical protein n=1 Tax=unclassified Janibacter TaxID=2649294 RepID=UPI0020CB86F7|nr:hypothetical protein [Janibacter sp. CX7]UTT65439.1 hypothetical protein NMQ01_12055 [Janibacter sp. CX7]